MKRYHIVGRAKGSEDKYFCSCPTQGEQFLEYAYSMSYVFTHKGKAMRKRDKLKERWKGLTLRVCRYTDGEESMADRPGWY